MAYYLKPAGISGGCCDCSQHVGCDCGGASCQINCRSKAENAELCGYPEFGTPSDPPKKYRKKVWAGTMFTGSWSVPGCPGGSGEPVAYNGAITATGAWGDASGSISASPVEIDAIGNRVKYRITAKTFTPNSTPTIWGTATDIRLSVGSHDGLDSSGGLNIGDEFWLSRSGVKNPWTFFIQANWTLNSWTGNDGSYANLDVSKAVDRSVRDVWDITNEFANEPGCATTENDLSNRHAKAFGAYKLTAGGDEESWAGFGGTPLEGYGALAEVTEQTNTTRKTSGKGDCQGGGPYQKAEGDVTETLSLEDSEEDAMARASAALEWNAVGPCSSHTTYITGRGEVLGPYGFGYRKAQVRAQLSGLVVGHNYTVTFRVWRRVFDAGSAYAAFQLISININATAASMFTEWQDVPVQHGYETRVMSCSCIAV